MMNQQPKIMLCSDSAQFKYFPYILFNIKEVYEGTPHIICVIDYTMVDLQMDLLFLLDELQFDYEILILEEDDLEILFKYDLNPKGMYYWLLAIEKLSGPILILDLDLLIYGFRKTFSFKENEIYAAKYKTTDLTELYNGGCIALTAPICFRDIIQEYKIFPYNDESILTIFLSKNNYDFILCPIKFYHFGGKTKIWDDNFEKERGILAELIIQKTKKYLKEYQDV